MVAYNAGLDLTIWCGPGWWSAVVPSFTFCLLCMQLFQTLCLHHAQCSSGCNTQLYLTNHQGFLMSCLLYIVLSFYAPPRNILILTSATVTRQLPHSFGVFKCALPKYGPARPQLSNRPRYECSRLCLLQN